MSPTDLAKRLNAGEKLHLLDVRGEDEFSVASLPDSRLLPLHELQARVNELVEWQDEEVVVYCHHGVRSLSAISFLSQFGFKQLFNLDGGIDRWSLEVDSAVTRY